MEKQLFGYVKMRNSREKFYCPTVFYGGQNKVLRGKKFRTAEMAISHAENYQRNIAEMEKK